ncbi:MAG: ribosome-associated translation inhibitor RaiA [Bacillota bacterium]
MKINVRGKNIEATPSLVDYAQKKIGKLDKHFDENTDVQVVMSIIREEHIVEVTVNLNGLILRGEESTGDMYASIDQVVDKLERQVKKYKTRMNKSMRQKGLRQMSEQQAALEAESKEEEEGTPRVVRTKRFPLKPMDVEEAILQMDLLGHHFFVFTNAETEDINVIYKRKDGNYGLIEPE